MDCFSSTSCCYCCKRSLRRAFLFGFTALTRKRLHKRSLIGVIPTNLQKVSTGSLLQSCLTSYSTLDRSALHFTFLRRWVRPSGRWKTKTQSKACRQLRWTVRLLQIGMTLWWSIHSSNSGNLLAIYLANRLALFARIELAVYHHRKKRWISVPLTTWWVTI